MEQLLQSEVLHLLRCWLRLEVDWPSFHLFLNIIRHLQYFLILISKHLISTITAGQDLGPSLTMEARRREEVLIDNMQHQGEQLSKCWVSHFYITISNKRQIWETRVQTNLEKVLLHKFLSSVCISCLFFFDLSLTPLCDSIRLFVKLHSPKHFPYSQFLPNIFPLEASDLIAFFMLGDHVFRQIFECFPGIWLSILSHPLLFCPTFCSLTMLLLLP